MTTPTAAHEGVRPISSVVNTIAGLLRNSPALTQGEVAALRRMDPRHPVAAFFKIEGLALDEILPGNVGARWDLENRWAAIIVGLAHLGDLHQPEYRLGHALVTAGFSELRFARLVQADSDQLIDELPSLARFLMAKGAPADWTAAAQLILSAGRADEEVARRHVARDYYGALARQEKTEGRT